MKINKKNKNKKIKNNYNKILNKMKNNMFKITNNKHNKLKLINMIYYKILINYNKKKNMYKSQIIMIIKKHKMINKYNSKNK